MSASQRAFDLHQSQAAAAAALGRPTDLYSPDTTDGGLDSPGVTVSTPKADFDRRTKKKSVPSQVTRPIGKSLSA